MPPRADILGARFGRLVVIGEADATCRRRVVVRCDCGVVKTTFANVLVSGESQSCGCRRRELNAARFVIHGCAPLTGRRPPEYLAWSHMKRRVCRPSPRDGSHYVDAGVYVCSRWSTSFVAFALDMGARPSPRHSIDRVDNDGSYTCGRHDLCDDCREKNAPANCRWATAHEQARNKSNNRLITHDGRSLCIAEWSSITGIPSSVIWARIARGWSESDAITKSVWRGNKTSWQRASS